MAYVQEPFTPDIPGSVVVPAHQDNVRPGDNHPKVNVFHTPEEEADDIEVTPYFFSRRIYDAQGRQRRASTHAYTDNDGDLFQMVPEKYGAIANGVTADRSYPAGTNPNISLNLQSRSNEIEGYARNIHLTMPRGSVQWKTVVRWTLAGHQMYGIPLDRAHNIGHYEVSNTRTDPGALDIDAIVEDAVALLEKGQEPHDMTTYKLFNTWNPAKLWNIQYDSGVPMWRRWIVTPEGAAVLIAAHGEPETISLWELRTIPEIKPSA